MKRQLGIGALIVLIMAALVLTGCDTAANSGSDGGNASGSSTVLDGKVYADDSGIYELSFKDGKVTSSSLPDTMDWSYSVNGESITVKGVYLSVTTTYTGTIDKEYKSIKLTHYEMTGMEKEELNWPELKLKTE